MSLSKMTSASFFPYFSLCYEIIFSSQYYVVYKTYYCIYSLLIANMQHTIYDYKQKVVMYHEYTIDHYQIQ